MPLYINIELTVHMLARIGDEIQHNASVRQMQLVSDPFVYTQGKLFLRGHRSRRSTIHRGVAVLCNIRACMANGDAVFIKIPFLIVHTQHDAGMYKTLRICSQG